MRTFKILCCSESVTLTSSAMIIRHLIIYVTFPQQIRVRATDNGGRSAEGLVGVSVNRNLNAPRFETEAYRTTIQDNEPLSSSFLRVTAVDNDVQVTNYFTLVPPVFHVDWT